MESYAYPTELLGQIENGPLDRPVEYTEGDPFHIGQCYDDEPAKQLKCYKCGGVEFHVAEGSWWTGIRCVKCRWEWCIHDG